jgi:hypothetical protein
MRAWRKLKEQMTCAKDVGFHHGSITSKNHEQTHEELVAKGTYRALFFSSLFSN